MLEKDKFRAKSSNGWQYGNIVHLELGVQIWEDDGGHYFIDPKTAGKFTGFYDRNDNEIYEGDIVKTTANTLPEYQGMHKVEFVAKEWHTFCLISLSYKKGICEKGICENLSDYIKWNYIEIVGNVYDNPKLLQGRQTNLFRRLLKSKKA